MRCLIKTPRLLSISYLLMIYIVLSPVSSLSLGVLTLVCFTPYMLALVLVSKNGGVGVPFVVLLRSN